MNKLTIPIILDTDYGRFGELTLDGKRYISCEREWNNNAPYLSSIPLGLYELAFHDTERHPATFALVNHELGVYHQPDVNGKRYACVIHPASWPIELMGCLSFGSWWLAAENRLGVRSSRQAVREVLDYIANNNITHIELAKDGAIPIYDMSRTVLTW